jgi:ATP/maltotriose-dependent transcriptional regulator MalT
MWGDWLYKNTKGQQVAAARRSEDLVALSRKLGDDQYVLQAHHSRWTNFFFLGDAGVARADTLTGIRLYDREGHRHHKHLYGGHDPGVCAHNFGAGAAWVTGHTREARALVDGALSLARELDHGISSVTAHILAPIVLSNAGATAKGQAMAEQMIGLCEKLGVLQFIGGGKVMAGACIALQGDATLGLRLIEEGLTSHRKTTWVVMSPTLLALAAEAHLRVGNTAHALDLLSEARDASQKSDVRWYVPEALRLEAETLLETGQIRADDAIARLRAVVELSRQQGALVFEWRAAATLARVVTQTGRDDQARQDLQTLVAKSAEGRDSPDLEAVKSLLSTLE